MRVNFIILLLLFLTIFNCSKDSVPKYFIARINKSYITDDDIPNSISKDKESLKKYVTDWIIKEALYLEAKKYHFDKDERLLQKVENYKKSLVIDEFIKYFVNSRIKISENDIRKYYLENRNKLFVRNFDEAKVIHVVVKTYSEAKTIKSAFLSNNQKELEKLYNQYKFETKVIKRGQPIIEIDKTIFDTPPRRVLGPIATDYGYHVIKVLERNRKGSIIPIDEVRDEIIQRLTQIKIQESYSMLVDSILKKYKYEIRIE
ncbi:MAG: peptidyl-prolyl cis-trans isomerase [Candidatus Marinimicrobia bacterium]|nr:peptidyl-prolyl cis-trans isomerase [Candidatus Neomarinimicrobiota bacterium]